MATLTATATATETTTTISSGRRRDSSSSSAKSSSSSSWCPYAGALLLAEQEPPATGASSNATSNSESSSAAGAGAGTGASNSLQDVCPAFAKGSCPFKDATSAEHIQQALLQVPPSHLHRNSGFVKVLQGLHGMTGAPASSSSSSSSTAAYTTTTTSTATNAIPAASVPSPFQLPGGCPVASLLRKSSSPPVSFADALEEGSLASVMARLAQHAEQERKQQFETLAALAFQSPSSAKVPPQRIEEEESESNHSDTAAPAKNHDNDNDNDPTQGPEEEALPDNIMSDIAATTTTTTTPNKSTTNLRLSTALKTGTAASHKAAEDVHFVSNFIQGKIDKDLYGQLVVMLYHVYDALEECLDAHGPQQFASCHFPLELSRREALRDDVDFWHGSSNSIPPPTPAALDYVQRLRDIGTTKPLLLLSHAYTRYLGDLSGGKILARVARRALHLDRGTGSGLDFYEFQNVASAKRFKDQYRTALDDLALTPEQIHDLVAEANVAFGLNVRLFEELDVMAGVPGATVRPLSDVLAYANDPVNAFGDRDIDGGAFHSVGRAADSNQCPFAAVATGGAATSATLSSKQHPLTTPRVQCPWPFILLHDPPKGFRDARTWAVLGLLLCWAWSAYSGAVLLRK